MKRNLLIILLLTVIMLLASCAQITWKSDDKSHSSTNTENNISTENGQYQFPDKRTEYVLDLSDDGTLVTHKNSGETQLVPYGEEMYFDGHAKYSKDISHIMQNIRSHAEAYISMDESRYLPVDFLRTGAYWHWNGMSAKESMERRFESPFTYPDCQDKVIVAYVNAIHFSGVDGWDFAFDPNWDADGDGYIDEDVGELPEYVELGMAGGPWLEYTSRFWTESWYEMMKQRIDMIAAQNFDGIMMDCLDGYERWAEYEYNQDPSIPYEEYSQKYSQLFIEYLQKVSSYAKQTYGTAFIITGNLSWNSYTNFLNIGEVLDGGYYQNAVLSWDGTGDLNGACLSQTETYNADEVLGFLDEQGFSLLTMDHIGRGDMRELDWGEFDDNEVLKMDKFLFLFNWAIDSGSTPYLSPVSFGVPYSSISETPTINAMLDTGLPPDAFPRFSRVLEGTPPFADTKYNDWVIGSDADDVILTGGGDDLVYAGAGNDDVDCGEGIDGAYYIGMSSEYLVYIDGNSLSITNIASGEIDLFDSLEYIVFSDKVEVIE